MQAKLRPPMSAPEKRDTHRSPVCQAGFGYRGGGAVEPGYAVALLDRQGNLLGACTATSLPGEVEMPLGVNLRTHDLRSYLSQDRGFFRPRLFPLVSASWVQVDSRRVRVGIYVESGDRRVSTDRLEPDLGSIAAILSAQVA
jgi:hypothetical protein